MPTPSIDPQRFKDGQRSAWDGMSAGWETATEIFERGGLPMTERLLELGGVRSGHSVLDLGTGHGEPALSAAEVVGPDGRVVGVDLSPAMLKTARARASALHHVEFVEGDVESIDLPAGSFDVVLSRWGMMFVVDQLAAFKASRRVLRSGGVLAAAVWGPPSSVPMLHTAIRVLTERLQLPTQPPEQPGTFSMSDRGTLARTLTEAGFAEVTVTEFIVPFWVNGADEYAAFSRAVTPQGVLDLMRNRFGSEDDPGTWDAVAAAVEPYSSGDGRILLPSTALCVRATA
ncbi:class I SAM-dependent methyltransferase [Streptomyces sp. N2-109]|uniref:Class I SAM-dependent methyltransferase n=1 Tax=Streptomyces gossypii TaxID=2883101 RepID=A0ABT2JVX1_9ACTN|nr:class I SAM-dependent methyltransferase [Streptomyces gossypii]MCT2592042.1 class I SAM-dependent methyltransferase [Streptomyces gossypii]